MSQADVAERKSTAKKKAADERRTVAVKYRILPYFAVEVVDDPQFRGTRGVGPSPLEALTNIRGRVRDVYPFSRFDIEEVIVNPEVLRS